MTFIFKHFALVLVFDATQR